MFARAVTAFAVVLILVSGTALVADAHSFSGVSCSAGTSSVTVSWSGEMRAWRYTAWLTDSSGSESGKIVDWSTRTTGSASAEFTGLAPGDYDVRVVMQTVDGSFINIGNASCTVAETSTTTTTAQTTTTTVASSSSAGTLSCTTGTSSITVSLDPADGTTGWEVWAEHSSGHPRLGQLVAITDGTEDELSIQFTQVAQGTYSVYGNARFSGAHRYFTGISCTVGAAAGGL